MQTHADAMGTWSDGNTDGRRGWEQSTRIDLRSVANAQRQLPYHVAWQRGFRQTAQILNPTIAIDLALENVRELEEGSLLVSCHLATGLSHFPLQASSQLHLQHQFQLHQRLAITRQVCRQFSVTVYK